MNLAEILIISIGLSFDIFAVTVCVGATLQKIEKKKLVCMGLIFCIWQLIAVGLGFLVARFPVMQTRTSEMQNMWDAFSVIIFLALGVYMFAKGWRKKDFLERRGQISYQKAWAAAMMTSLDAFFAGIGFGFLGTEILAVGRSLELGTLIFALAGTFVGYRLGYEQRTKAYAIGGIILIIAGIDVIIRYLIQ